MWSGNIRRSGRFARPGILSVQSAEITETGVQTPTPAPGGCRDPEACWWFQ